MDSLRVLADQTDGRAIVNRNDPLPELQQMMRELSAYYLLGYTSTVAPRDGKFHQIQVRVKRHERRGPRAQGLLGVHGRGSREGERDAQAGPAPRRGRWRSRKWRPSSSQAAGGTLNLVDGRPSRADEKALVTLVWEAGATRRPIPAR